MINLIRVSKYINPVIIAFFFAALLCQRYFYLQAEIIGQRPVAAQVVASQGSAIVVEKGNPNAGCCNVYVRHAFFSFVIIAFCITIMTILKVYSVKSYGGDDFINIYSSVLFLLAPWGLVTLINIFTTQSCEKWWPWVSLVILLAAGIVYPVVKYFRLLNSSAYKLFIHFGNGIGHCINAVLYVLAARRIDLSVVPNPNACCSCPGIRACCAKSLGFLLVIWALVQLAIAITIMCIDLDKAVKEGDEVSTAED